MRRITLDPRGAVTLDGNQNTASVRTVMRTRGVATFFMVQIITSKKRAAGGRPL